MSRLNRQTVIWALEELADRDEQERLWLSDGSSGEVSSFTEVVCATFDGGVNSELESGNAEEPVRSLFLKLRSLLKKLPENAAPQQLIDDPQMEEVRKTSMEILKELRKTGKAQT